MKKSRGDRRLLENVVRSQLYGRIRFDPKYFELVNAANQVDCMSRDVIPDTDPDMSLITWQPPGDYAFSWEESELMGVDQACDTMDRFIGSEIRVLP